MNWITPVLSAYLTCERGEEGEEPEDLLGLFLVGQRLEVDFISTISSPENESRRLLYIAVVGLLFRLTASKI